MQIATYSAWIAAFCKSNSSCSLFTLFNLYSHFILCTRTFGLVFCCFVTTCRTSRRISRSFSKLHSSTVSTSNISFFGTNISPSYRASRTSDTARGNSCSSAYPFWNSLGAPLIVSIGSWRLVPTCTLSASSPTIVLAKSAMKNNRVVLIAACSPPHPHKKFLMQALGGKTIQLEAPARTQKKQPGGS